MYDSAAAVQSERYRYGRSSSLGDGSSIGNRAGHQGQHVSSPSPGVGNWISSRYRCSHISSKSCYLSGNSNRHRYRTAAAGDQAQYPSPRCHRIRNGNCANYPGSGTGHHHCHASGIGNSQRRPSNCGRYRWSNSSISSFRNRKRVGSSSAVVYFAASRQRGRQRDRASGHRFRSYGGSIGHGFGTSKCRIHHCRGCAHRGYDWQTRHY